MRKRKWLSLFMAFLLFFSSLPLNSVLADEMVRDEAGKINLVDRDASPNARKLFKYLQNLDGSQVLFGHQHATDEGLTLKGEVPRTASEESEVFNAVGDYPAVFGWDTLSLDGYEKPGVSGDPEQSIQNLAESMKKAHKLGGIVTLSTHPHNFVTGGSFNDINGNVVENILPGGSKHEEFNKWLDNIAELAKILAEDDIPIIFRVFHEQTGGWFWWGASTTTPEQYKALYRYTVEYLRDIKGVHNLLYAFSPSVGKFGGDVESYLSTYPGDEYVDIFGIDRYDDKQNAGSESFLNNLVKDLEMLVELAEQKGKIAALTEFGYSPEGMKETGNNLNWYTDILNAIKSSEKAKKISYMLTWANFGWPNNMFVPYKDIYNELGGDHELLPNFQNFYDDEFSAFRNEIKGKVYVGQAPETFEKNPLMHVASPVSGNTVTDNTVTIRVRVLNDTPEKVVYFEKGSNEEQELTYDAVSQYYVGTWTPTADINGSSAELTVKTVFSNGSVQEETVKIFVKVPEIPIKNYTFDTDITGLKSNTAYPETIESSIEHGVLNGEGMLKFSASGFQKDETWQELKLEFTDLEGFDLSQINRVSFDAYIPAALNSGNASLRGVVMFPDDWETKFGMSETVKNMTDLDLMTIDGIEYAVYSVSIDISKANPDARTVALSLVGSGFEGEGDIFIDNIKLANVFIETPKDPSLVDNFEFYLGDDDLLRKNYVSAGDGVEVSLTTEHKNEGTYGLKYDYTLAGQGYAGANKALGGVDWSQFNQLQFWIKPDGKGQRVNIQLMINGQGFEAYRYYDDEEVSLEIIDFAEFKPAAWADQSLILTKELLKNVSTFSIYIDAVDGAQLKSTLYFDDIRVLYNPDAPSIPNGGTGPGSMPAEPGILYDFEEGTEGWAVEENKANAKTPVITDEEAANGSYSLMTEFDLSGTSFELVKVQNIDLTQVGAISVKAKLSTGKITVKLYIKTGSNWAWADSGEVEINDQEFTTVRLYLKGLLDVNGEVPKLDEVKSIGLMVLPENSDGIAKLYIDEVRLEGETEEQPGEDSEEPSHPEDPGTVTDELGDESDSDESGNGEPNQGNKEDTKGEDRGKAGNEETLPSTATNLWNGISIGILLILVAVILGQRRKQLN